MRSDVGKPLNSQVLPPFFVTYMPVPTLVELRTQHSPVPTHTVSGWFWSMRILPILWGYSSKIGRNEAPPLWDFHTPPLAPPIYKIAGFLFTPSTSETRPLIKAGPMLRERIPPKLTERGVFSGLISGFCAIEKWIINKLAAIRMDDFRNVMVFIVLCFLITNKQFGWKLKSYSNFLYKNADTFKVWIL